MDINNKSFNFEISGSNIERIYNFANYTDNFYVSVGSILKRARISLKAKAWDETARRYNVKKSDFNKHTKISHRDIISPYGAKSTISFRGYKIPLASFLYGKNKRKVSEVVKARILKAGSTSEYRRAFQIYTDGREKVFERITSRKLPLREITTLATAQMINNKNIMENMETEATLTINKRIEHEIKRLMNN